MDADVRINDLLEDALQLLENVDKSFNSDLFFERIELVRKRIQEVIVLTNEKALHCNITQSGHDFFEVDDGECPDNPYWRDNWLSRVESCVYNAESRLRSLEVGLNKRIDKLEKKVQSVEI
jgi:hypothetical protein